ncbi:MAG: prepilin-type N-terminal cleavage/methylation domain-containing protein [Candidatus Saccharimonadales bacterium]
MNHVVNKKAGFTIIELMLAMAFVATLLVAVAMTVIQIGNTYNRGITFKNVNQIGRSISSEVQRSIIGVQAFDLGTRYIQQGEPGNYWGGRLCTGQYTYIWNYGKAIQAGDISRLNTYAGGSTKTIRFIKVPDSNASYCQDVSKKAVLADSIELLTVGPNTPEYDLALHSFSIITSATATDVKTGQQLYSIEFLVGTNNSDALSLDYQSCKLPGEDGADPSYCSVSRFNVLARAGNTVK